MKFTRMESRRIITTIDDLNQVVPSPLVYCEIYWKFICSTRSFATQNKDIVKVVVKFVKLSQLS